MFKRVIVFEKLKNSEDGVQSVPEQKLQNQIGDLTIIFIYEAVRAL